jgi:hypothetical protein
MIRTSRQAITNDASPAAVHAALADQRRDWRTHYWKPLKACLEK